MLGLSAYIQAHPYDVPAWMPAILVILGRLVSEPEPIKSTVKKTMSEFWRTQRDSWMVTKAMFTDDQLDVISDLLIGPSYYA